MKFPNVGETCDHLQIMPDDPVIKIQFFSKADILLLFTTCLVLLSWVVWLSFCKDHQKEEDSVEQGVYECVLKCAWRFTIKI